MQQAGGVWIPDWDAWFFKELTRSGGKFQTDLYEHGRALVAGRALAVDVGAHVGILSKLMAADFAAVVSFEPVPENIDCFRRNVTAENVTLHPVAIGRAPGKVRIVNHNVNSGCWRADKGDSTDLCALDAFGLSPDLLKLDVEGFEGEVLLGATETLARSSPVVIFEDNGLGEKFYGTMWVDPKDVLREAGYTFRKRIERDEIWTR